MEEVLVVYDTQGNIVFTQTNATGNYKIIKQSIPNGKEIAGVDAVNNKLILKDSTVDKSELEKAKEEIESLKQSLTETQDAVNSLLMMQIEGGV